MFSEFFWWDYDDPNLSVGKLSSEIEISIAKESDNRYLYTGLGYHRHGLYKSRKKGFEWWTGREWSTNKELFRELLDKDSKVESLSDLYYRYKDYYKKGKF